MDNFSGSRLEGIFEAALEGYERQTGMKLIDHPLARQLENCNSIESVSAILEGQARTFGQFRGEDGKVMKSLKCVVQVLYGLTTSAALGEGIGLPFSPAKAIFASLAVLLSAIKDVSSSYDALVDLLESIEHFLNRLDIYTKFAAPAVVGEIIVKIMVELLSTIALVTKQIKQGGGLKFIKKLLGETEIEAVLQRIDRLTQDEARTVAAQTLEVVYSLVQNVRVVMDDGKASADGIRDALTILQDIASKRNQPQRDKLQRDAQKWLSPPDPWENHNNARESHHSGTSAWFIQGSTFTQWKSLDSNSLLWIHGKPGAGKSILCSTIIENINDMHKQGLALLAVFYCDFRDHDKKNIRGLVSSLLVQLCHQSDSYSTILSDFYSAYDNGSRHASDEALIRCLKDMLKYPGQAPVYIIIDALDECPDTFGRLSPREKVLKLVLELVGLCLPSLRICITSRPEADIRKVLGPFPFHQLSLHDERGQMQDIVDYITSVISTDWKMERWRPEDRELVTEVLTQKADGMFRWVACQIDYLRRCLPACIRYALEELPESLDATYARILQDVDQANWEFAHRLFQAVAVASRPLRVEELAEFLAFDFGTGPTPTFRTGWRPEYPTDAILSTCSSLLVVVKTGDSAVIQFSHFSVKEFLTSTRLSETKDTISRFHISLTPAHTIVAQACLGILLHLDENVTIGSLKNFPLAGYAAKHWLDHVRFENVPPSTQDGTKRLFDPRTPHLSVWVWIYDPAIDSWHQAVRSERPSRPKASYLHYAAICGLPDLVSFLVVECSQDVNASGFDVKATPLHVASQCAHVDVVQVLLLHGADVNGPDWFNSTPLHRVARGGHVELTLMLLEHGADVSAQTVEKWTPLHRASQGGNVEVARVLLEHGADASIQNVDKWTPLHLASQGGHVEFSRVLLQHGVDVDAQAIDKFTPLHLASQGGHVEVAQALLQHGADRNPQDVDKLTPLYLASKVGHVEIARLLLGYGADVNIRNVRTWTPLHWASQEGHVEVSRVLLESGAGASAQSISKWTPLHSASHMGHVEVALVLLEHGADASAQNMDKWSPLHCASQQGHIEVARVLLKHGADARTRNMKKWTPLHLASREGYVELVRMLLEHGADANAQNVDKWTPLHLASQKGFVEVAQVLLEHGAAPSVRDERKMTPVHLALQEGHVEVAQVLLERRAIRMPREYTQTLLHWVSQEGQVEVARVLLELGADASSQDVKKWAPLHWASQEGHVEVTRLLLEHGADTSAWNENKQTPLHIASEWGHVAVAQVLLEHGANALARDGNKLTPLYFALKGGHVELSRMLRERAILAMAQEVSQ